MRIYKVYYLVALRTTIASRKFVIYLCNLVIFSHYVILRCILQEKNYILTCDAFVTVVDMVSATHLSSFSCYVDMIDM
jgi:hypothetical protein